MGNYIKYKREVRDFVFSEDSLDFEVEIQKYLDSIIERGFEIIYYQEEDLTKDILKIIVLIGKPNKY